MTFRVSMIPYANMAPYRLLGEIPGCTFVELVPSASVTALLDNEIIAAAVPVGALPMLAGSVEFLGEFGIAANAAVGSVFLFSKYPLEALRRPLAIHLTSQSATSVRLLYLIIGYANGFDEIPYVTDDREAAAAELLIGDDAMRRAEADSRSWAIDLASEWYRVHRMPFVFARWVIRKDAPASARHALSNWLDQLRDRDDALVLAGAADEAKRIGISEVQMIRYLRGMKRVLGPEELLGQALFLGELEKHVPISLFEKDNPSTTRAVSTGHTATKGRRVDREECLRLLGNTPLGEVMAAAHEARMIRHPEGRVTYVRDTNPNYTNICRTKCRFCAFCRNVDDAEAYTLTPEELVLRVGRARENGATTVLLQGGHNPSLTLGDWVAYLRALRSALPDMHLHPFSPPEILFMAEKEGVSTLEVLDTLVREGIRTIPGGGAEILSDEIRQCIAPGKYSVGEWIRVMTEAHGLGLRTTATMMFGHVETDAHIADHLFRLREVQDRTHGFSSFIPWSFKPGRSPLTEQVSTPAHPARYVRIIAVARLVLDNFDHIQSSWFSENERAGMIGLLAGADDFGGTLVEENVLKESGYERETTESRVRALIRHAGFTPALRDSHYRVIAPAD